MDDYYSIIARAVSRLPSKTDEARHGIYERARTALQEKLRTLDPPISEVELANAQLTLEEAIRRVEQDVAIETAVHRMEQDLIPTDTAPDFKRRRRYKAWGSVRHTPQIINDMMGKQRKA